MTRVVFVFLSVLYLGCSNKAVVPVDILPEEKMEMVLWQLMQTDEFFTNYVIKDSTKNTTEERTRLYQQVFSLNNTSKEVFRKSYEYYINRPEISRPMFDSLAARASRRREEVYTKPHLKKDTLRTDSTLTRKLLKLRRDSVK